MRPKSGSLHCLHIYSHVALFGALAINTLPPLNLCFPTEHVVVPDPSAQAPVPLMQVVYVARRKKRTACLNRELLQSQLKVRPPIQTIEWLKDLLPITSQQKPQVFNTAAPFANKQCPLWEDRIKLTLLQLNAQSVMGHEILGYIVCSLSLFTFQLSIPPRPSSLTFVHRAHRCTESPLPSPKIQESIAPQDTRHLTQSHHSYFSPSILKLASP